MIAAWVPGAASTDAPPYSWDTIPDSDPEDDENATEEGGPNPDPRELEPVPGYETVVFNSGTFMFHFTFPATLGFNY